MLQQASTDLTVSESSDDLITNESWSIDTYADGLMDELFTDIDQILNGTFNLPAYTVKAEQVAETLTIPQIVLPSSVPGVPQYTNKPLNRGEVKTRPVKSVNKKRQKTRLAWRRWLILGTTLGVAIAAMIYLLNSRLFYRLTLTLAQGSLQIPHTLQPKKVDIQGELVDYMLGALAVIDQQEIKNNQKSAQPGIATGANSHQTNLALANDATTGILPPPQTANNTPPQPNRSSSIVERIYIPVYQAPAPMRYTPPVNPVIPKPPAPQVSRPDVVKNALNTVRKAAQPVSVNMLAAAVRTELKPVKVRTAPIAVRQAPNILPAIPVVQFSAAPPKLPTAPTTQQPASLPTASAPAAPAPTHILEGLLESADKSKSAALFSFEGVTHRINVGESIGSSGWTLVNVVNGEVVIRRNGEVRSIYTGQKL
ncbi:MAG: hypothetical protein HEQ35_14185 [Gloeotrichia echinulata IR180]